MPLLDRARDRLLVLAVGMSGFLTAWLATDPRVLMTLNWDNASYISSYASGQWSWSTVPWNSHYGIGQVYLAGSAVARALGGNYLEGFRLANAIALGIGAGVVADSLRRLLGNWRGSRAVSLFLTLAFLWSWGDMLLVYTVEDNILFVPEAAAILALCLARLDGWRARDSVLAGVLGAIGVLMSWQAGAYLGPALYVAAVLGGSRSWMVRLRDVLIIPLATLATLIVWVFLLRLTSSAFHLRELFHILFSRPEPSYFPEGVRGWLTLLVGVRDTLFHLGVGICHELGPAARDSAALNRQAVWLGAALVVPEIAFLIWATWHWLRTHTAQAARLHFLAVTLFALTWVTSLYRDLLQDKYKRYDYLPLVLVHVAAALIGCWIARSNFRRRVQLAIVGALLLAVGAGLFSVHENHRWHAEMPSLRPPNYYGVGHISWLGYMRQLRHDHPTSCSFVFALPDVAAGQWNHEVTAALGTELPNYLVVTDRPVTWKKPLKTALVPVAKTQLHGCEWISPAAQRALH